VAFLGVVISCLIFPNSLKIVSAISLSICFFCAVFNLKRDANLLLALSFWLLSFFVTFIYTLVGIFHGASIEAVIQVFLIYIIFPLVWIYVIGYLLQAMPLALIVKGLIVVGVFASLSVLFFYYSFLNYGPESVTFFIEEPNVDTSTEGYVGAAMYVFGSLIFLVGGYVASFSSLTGLKKSYLLLTLFILVALMSGRSALILSVLIGLFVNVIAMVANKRRTIVVHFIRNIFLSICACILLFILLNNLGLEFEKILSPLIEKISAMGGEGRSQQFSSLLNGIGDNFGFGSGHGIGVEYKVSDIYPWRYEMVWIATVFRVGVIGAIVYSALFIFVTVSGFWKLLKNKLDENELFIFGGFISAFVASNTNPYIEAFVFQWMFVLPILLFTRNKLPNLIKI
jgi:hypothetical protein